MLPPSAELWKKIGITFATWADAILLYGVGRLGFDLYQTILHAINQRTPPLNWSYPFATCYANETDVLWVMDPGDRRSFLPQVLLIDPYQGPQETTVRVALLPDDFHATLKAEIGLEFYQRRMDGTVNPIFFDGENARLQDWDISSATLTFQGSFFFDYVQSNLALDVPLPVIGSLRQQLAAGSRLEPLATSRLANFTGINGLVFSNDGHMIIQRRSNAVLIRPGEVCSGFSGTIDKIDVTHAIQEGGLLANLDILREMVEELGIHRREVAKRQFLGLTRELIRGGTPELFYAVDVNLPMRTIMARIPKDREGERVAVFMGPYAHSRLDNVDPDVLSTRFWHLVEATQVAGGGPISVPLLTNMVLWYRRRCPNMSGVAALPPLPNLPGASG